MQSIFESEFTLQENYGSHHGDQYAKYIDLVTFVRAQQLKECYNLPVEEFEERGYTLIISTAHINFIRDPEKGEALNIKTQIDNFSGGTCNVNFWIYKKRNGKLVADGYLTYTLKSSTTNFPDQFPDDFIERLSI